MVSNKSDVSLMMPVMFHMFLMLVWDTKRPVFLNAQIYSVCVCVCVCACVSKLLGTYCDLVLS
jgi:hypothetical protein